MRRGLFAVLAALMLMLGALPFGASAAAPNIGRISATSYLDTNGNESDPLCFQVGFVEVAVAYGGFGSELGGSGSGDLLIQLDFGSFYFSGELEIDGELALIEGGGLMTCLTPGYVVFSGGFYAEPLDEDSDFLDGDESICGDLAGYIMDGVHQNQGRVSWTLSGGAACVPG